MADWKFMSHAIDIIAQELPKFLTQMNAPFSKDEKQSVMLDSKAKDKVGQTEKALNELLLGLAAGLIPASKLATQFPKAAGAAVSGGSAYASGDPADILPGIGGLLLGSGDAGATIIGKNAKTWDNVIEDLSAELRAAGYPEKEIWQNGGYYKGPIDGKMRSEIADNKAKFREMGGDSRQTEYLGNLLDHPELFKAYPDLKNIILAYDPGRPNGGSHQKGVQEIIKLGRKGQSDTILHEIQHAIQVREGFVRGASPSAMRQTQDYKSAFADLVRTFQEPTQATGWNGWGSVGTESDGASFADLERILLNELYSRVAGEVEARAVPYRKFLTQEQLREILPTESYDRPIEMLIDSPFR